jgi:hypothetical protein
MNPGLRFQALPPASHQFPEHSLDCPREAQPVKNVFHDIRRVAYLALDTHHTPSVVNLDLGQVLTDPRHSPDSCCMTFGVGTTNRVAVWPEMTASAE